jgi:hypothetical protein
MRTRKEIEEEIVALKSRLSDLSQRNEELKKIMQDGSEESTSKHMFLLLKYMMEENKKTTMVLNQILGSITRMEESDDEYGDTAYSPAVSNIQMQSQSQIILSDVDAKILQLIQISHNSMSCADEIMAQMGYGCRNAASARLNRLYRLGVLDRYQLGHKVYYKFDAGKAAKTLIVSPPQK